MDSRLIFLHFRVGRRDDAFRDPVRLSAIVVTRAQEGCQENPAAEIKRSVKVGREAGDSGKRGA